MRHINEVASWFNKNNILKKNEKEDNLRINLLCLYTKVAYTIKGLELECDEISFDEKLNINIGITNLNLETEFTTEELRILKTINREYGYLTMGDLLYRLKNIEGTLNYKNITSHLKNNITETLIGYERYKFNEKVVIVNNRVFFIDNEIIITDEIMKRIKKYSFEDQYIFTVYKSDDIEGLTIY